MKGFIKVKQVHSPIRRPGGQRLTLIGLGLDKIGRARALPNTPPIRGMVRKVHHLVRVLIEIKELTVRRFNSLGGYARDPGTLTWLEEVEWFATGDERLLGVLVRDRTDNDWGWIILGHDERLRFRAIDVNSCLSTADEARQELMGKLESHNAEPDEVFHQGDAEGPPVDFFAPVVANEKLHPSFRILCAQPRYSPARELMAAMMRFYEDNDGNFVEQFQTTAFDARLWEVYLFAAFVELGYAPAPHLAIPDFLFWGPEGSIGIEATSVNPAEAGDPVAVPQDSAQLLAYMENYIPIRLARVLKRKLEKKAPYWERPEMNGIPFLIAVQDFHIPGAMRMIAAGMSDYAFGVRHGLGDGKPERIKEHIWGKLREASGFFSLPKAENVSAIIVNSQGTLPKFNRLGFVAEFGDRRVRMIRTGVTQGEQVAAPFVHVVHEPGYGETWVEGMTVFHNPHALIPLSPQMVPGACHQFLQEDDSIVSLRPAFHPLFSATRIWMGPKPKRRRRAKRRSEARQ